MQWCIVRNILNRKNVQRRGREKIDTNKKTVPLVKDRARKEHTQFEEKRDAIKWMKTMKEGKKREGHGIKGQKNKGDDTCTNKEMNKTQSALETDRCFIALLVCWPVKKNEHRQKHKNSTIT